MILFFYLSKKQIHVYVYLKKNKKNLDNKYETGPERFEPTSSQDTDILNRPIAPKTIMLLDQTRFGTIEQITEPDLIGVGIVKNVDF